MTETDRQQCSGPQDSSWLCKETVLPDCVSADRIVSIPGMFLFSYNAYEYVNQSQDM